MSNDKDIELEIIKAKKMRELRKRLQEGTLDKREKDDRSILLDYLIERGDEVLKAAEEQYPAQMRLIIPRLAQVLRSGEIKGKITGADLLAILRIIGLNVRLNTTIRYMEDGKIKSISEKLKED
jgi:DNA-binding TFAR19-related protein (PDSD5 family)